jgi:hypothetical protein
VKALFGTTAREAEALREPSVRLGETGGAVAVVPAASDAAGLVRRLVGADADFERKPGASVYFVHRKAGFRDVYGLYGLSKGTSVRFRAAGRVELWDPWTGRVEPLAVTSQDDHGTVLKTPREASEIQLVVFSPGRPEREAPSAGASLRVYDIPGPWSVALRPTLDNRWGDFRWPPSPSVIGAEARRFRYAFEPRPGGAPSEERVQTSAFGPMLWRLGPFPSGDADAEAERRLAAAQRIDPRAPVTADSVTRTWEPYDFSWRWGVEADPGHQGYHGLKESVSDEFIRLGRPKVEATSIIREAEPGGSRCYLWTSVAAPRRMEAQILAGGLKPAALWLNGRRVASLDEAVPLAAGSNPVLARYDAPGTGWLVFAEPGFTPPRRAPGDLAMSWYAEPGVLPFDVRPEDPRPTGLYRFKAAPGLKAMTVTAIGQVEAWADGRPLAVSSQGPAADGAVRRRFALPDPIRGEAEVTLRVTHERGRYGGAALPEPVAFECGEGTLPLGDWSAREGLASYSGGVLYRTMFDWPAAEVRGPASIDLGDVACSAEVFLNGQRIGARVAPPWRFEIGPSIRSGENLLEVLVYNTLANHYLTIPTRYRGRPVSGLLGPVGLVVGE